VLMLHSSIYSARQLLDQRSSTASLNFGRFGIGRDQDDSKAAGHLSMGTVFGVALLSLGGCAAIAIMAWHFFVWYERRRQRSKYVEMLQADFGESTPTWADAGE